MTTPPRQIVTISGMAFEVITGTTTGGQVMSYTEAKAYAETGQRVACSRPVPPSDQHEDEPETEPFWTNLPHFKKRRHGHRRNSHR